MKQVTGKQRGRRILAWMLTLVVIMGGINLPGRTVKAEDKTLTGSGTVEDPYQIGSIEDLDLLNDKVFDNADNTNAVLINDIDLNGGWTRIGNETHPYKGTFDGKNHTISGGSYTYPTSFVGLFGYIASGATVKNVGVIQSTISVSSAKSVGAIAAYNSGTIENCYSGTGNTITAANNSITSTSTGWAGGICGENEAGGVIRYCYTVSGTSVNGTINGGIVGQNKGTVEYCYNAGKPSGAGYTGGIAGMNTNEGTEYGSIAYCYNSGGLGSGTKGGIVGRNANDGNIVNKCYYDKDTVGENVSGVVDSGSKLENITNCQALATSDFSSGKVTYLLNDGKTDGSQLWYQTLETDTYPVLANTHGTVYQTSGSKYCDGTSSSDASYSNTSSGSSAVIHKSIEAVAAKAATCTEAGNHAHYKCAGCGELYSDASGTQEITEASIQISALGHSLTAVPAKAATCTEDGNSAYWTCSRCKGIFSDAAGTNATTLDAVTIKSAGKHDYTKYTANEDGTTHTVTCTQCDAVKTSTEAHSGGTATCTSPAVCSKCGASYGSATGHTYGEPVFTWTAVSNGYTVKAVFTCSKCTSATDGHSKTIDCSVDVKENSSSCTTSGSKVYTASVTFNGKTYTETKTDTIAATGHTLTHKEAVSATCTTEGNKEYWLCTTCSKLYSDAAGTKETTAQEVKIAASGHTYTKITDNNDGTSHSISCSVCGDVHSAKVNHTGGTATCYARAKCEKCNAEYGSLASHTYGAPVFTWTSTATGYTANAVFTCTNTGCTATAEGHSKSEVCTVEGLVTKQADCTTSGSKVYTASVTFNGQTYTDTRTDTIAATGHSMVHTNAVSAGTCTGDGNKEYWSCSQCGKYYLDSQGNTETTLEDVTIKAPGHDYSGVVDNGNGTHSASCTRCGTTFEEVSHCGGAATCVTKAHCEVCNAEYGDYGEHSYGGPKFQWQKTDDGYTATAVFTCTNDGCTEVTEGHTKERNCTVEGLVTKQATCDEEGSKIYTATLTEEGKNYQDTKTVSLDVLEHALEHVTAVESGCTTAGNIEYWKCTNCNKLYLDEAGTKETTAENVVIAVSGHKYDSIVPDQDGTSHTISCSVCGDIQIAGELHSGGTATCYSKAKCEKCNAEYGEIAAHTYGAPVFNWTSTESGYTVEAVFTCSNGGCTESADGHSKSETCAVEKTDVKEAGCTEAGSISYEASVTFNGQTYTDTKTDIVEAVGHSMEYVEAVSAGTCTGDGNEEYWKCSRCGRYYLDSQGQTETSLEDVTIKAPGHAYKDVVDNGDGTHSASCERCGETISGESHFGGTATCAEQAHCEVCDAKYGEYGEHRYGEPEFQWQAAGDGYTATAVFTCVNDGCTTSLDGHTVTVDCTVEGPVVTEATTEMTGSKVYTAKVTFNEQQYTDTRTDVIPVVDTGKKPEESNPAQNPGTTGGNPEQPVPSVGERVTDSTTKAVYEVTASSGNEAAVTYVGSASKTETKATVPATVMIGNVSYKVTAIAKNAFANNKKLKTVTIGKNVKTVGDKAFYKCTSLTKVTIPENVKSLGKQAFYGDKKLKTITIKSTVLTKVGNKALTGIDKKATIKCPNKKTAAKYKKLFKSKTGYKKTMKIK